MENPKVPQENAHEPTEQARQPLAKALGERRITFAHDVDTFDKCSQSSSVYKEALSQPPATFTHKQRLQWLQERRSTGLYVQCDACDAWRYLPHVLDRHDVPEKWFCKMNPDKTVANCLIPEVPLHIREEEDLIHAEYSAGSLVWARMPGWPWWPAMVDDCPDAEEFYWLDGFSDIPTHYNVVFFDSFDVTRAWISPQNLKPYGPNKTLYSYIKVNKCKKRLEIAVKQANDANNLTLKDRLAKYSFITRYSGKISTPRKITKSEIAKFKAAMKRKFCVDFPAESSSDSEQDAAFVDVEMKSIKIKKVNATKEGNNEIKSNNNGKKRNMDKNAMKKNYKMNQSINNKSEGCKISHDVHKNKDNSQHSDVLERVKDSLLVIDTEDLNNTKEATNTQDTNNTLDTNGTLDPHNNQEFDTEKEAAKFKEPKSFKAFMVSSDAAENTDAFDTDSSKTYQPETQSESESMSGIVHDIGDRVASPSSDDFDF